MSSGERDAIAITRASGGLGRALIQTLPAGTSILGLDPRPFPDPPANLTMQAVDLRRYRAEEIFRHKDLKAVVHLGFRHPPGLSPEERRRWELLQTTRLLELCGRHQIPKLVLLSSSAVYGPSPRNSSFLTEEAPLLADGHFPELQALVAIDLQTQSFLHQNPRTEVVLLRPVHLVGPTLHNAASSYFRLQRPWTVLGFDPLLQLLHAEDLCAALRAALVPGIRGIYNVVGPGEIPLSMALRELGHPAVPLPPLLAQPLLERLERLHLTRFPAAGLAHLQWNCTVDGSRFCRDTGFQPSRTLAETLHAPLGTP